MKLLGNIDNTVFVSAVTFWEISLKYHLNKLELKNVIPDDLPGLAKETGFDILHLNENDASTFYKLPTNIHRDPFDRMLIWQALRNNITIISKDIKFNEYTEYGLNVVW